MAFSDLKVSQDHAAKARTPFLMSYRVGDPVEATVRVIVQSGEISGLRGFYQIRDPYPPPEPTHLPRVISIPMNIVRRDGESVTFSGVVPPAIVGGTYRLAVQYTWVDVIGTNGSGAEPAGRDIEVVDDPTASVAPPPVVIIE